MNKYLVEVEWSGYSRGYASYEVDAENEEAASKDYMSGKETERDVVRDYTEKEDSAVSLVSKTDQL